MLESRQIDERMTMKEPSTLRVISASRRAVQGDDTREEIPSFRCGLNRFTSPARNAARRNRLQQAVPVAPLSRTR